MFRKTSIAFCLTLIALAAPLAALTPGTDVLVPAVALAGDWVTDLYILNPGTETANVTIHLLVRGVANPSPETQNFVIASGETERLENVLANTFGKAEFGGALRISSDQPVVVNSRIFADKDGVTFGQGFKGVSRCAAVQEGESTDIVGLAKNASFRTNLVMIDATGDTSKTSPSQVRVTLYDEFGTQIATKEIELDGFEPFLQGIDKATVFGSSLVDFGYGTLHCEVLRGAVIFSASKVDNDPDTGDPTTLDAWSPSTCTEPPPKPEGDVYLYAADGEDDLSPEISHWDSGSTLTEMTDDPDYARVMKVEPGTGWGAPSSCMAFMDVGDYMNTYTAIVFKVKSDDLSAILVKVPEVELTYEFSSATDLGNGWYEVTAPLSGFAGNPALVPGTTQFGIHGGWSVGGTFYITDVMFTVAD